MPRHSTIWELLAVGDDRSVAIAAPGIKPMTYAGLRAGRAHALALNGFGVGRGDRVAIVLPNGPEMAVAFIATAAAATAAPLNPAYRAEEFEFYLSDIGAKALIVERGSQSPVVAVAAKLGVRLLELTPALEKGAGGFDLASTTTSNGDPSSPGFADPEDLALILHTSGTTSRPKIVPLAQRNVCASAGNIGPTLRFTPQDRGLCIMPLFHIHGLMAGLLAPLAAGSRVFCTPGFNALEVLRLDE